MHPCNNFGLWTVNKKLDECVTLHSNFLEMSYELNIKMKCLAPLHLGDVKNFLIPLRTLYMLYFYVTSPAEIEIISYNYVCVCVCMV